MPCAAAHDMSKKENAYKYACQQAEKKCAQIAIYTEGKHIYIMSCE